MPKLKPNAETHRIRALGYRLLKKLDQARLEIRKALELEPNVKNIKFTVASIDYFSALSPIALPIQLVSWPEPIDWLLVKKDNDSLVRLRNAAKIFKQLTEEFETDEEDSQAYQIWYLACLANHPERQEDAVDYCKKLLQDDPINIRAIAWAITRNYEIDFIPSENALSAIIKKEKPDPSFITALVNCKLALQKLPEAIEILEATKPHYEDQKADRIWVQLYSQSLAIQGNPEKALTVIKENGSGIEFYYAKMIVLKAMARKTEDWDPVAAFLENAYKETGDAPFLFECCSLKAHQGDWHYVATKAQELVDAIGTPEALRLAAIAYHNDKKFEKCIELLENNKYLFKQSRLTDELRRLRVNCQEKLGALPDAIIEAEAILDEDPSADNLLHVMDLLLTKGDLKRLAVVARNLDQISDVSPYNLLQASHIVQMEDISLATVFWKKAVSQNLPDNLISEALTLGYKLGLDDEIKPILKRMQELGERGNDHIKVFNLDDLISIGEQHRDRMNNLGEIYSKGLAPIHAFAKEMNYLMVDLFHYQLEQNEKSPNPIQQFSLFARHGGRKLSYFPTEPPKWRLNLDITAILLAAHLDILTHIENLFSPLRIPTNTARCLIDMKDKLTHHQPSRLQISEQIATLKSDGKIKTQKPEILNKDQAIIEEMGEHWVQLLENAHTKDGYLVCFLPLTTLKLGASPSSLPDSAKNIIIGINSIVESLYRNGPLSKEEYEKTLEILDDRGQNNIDHSIPNIGSTLFLQDGIIDTLVDANLHHTVCEFFEIYVGEWEIERDHNELEALKHRNNLMSWLDRIIDRINKGLETNTYEMIPSDGNNERDPSVTYTLYEKCLQDLLNFKAQTNDVVWSDDRFVNSHFRTQAAPMIGINEALKALVSHKSLSMTEYYSKIIRLRAANVRFIPIEKEEILYHLSQAKTKNESVIETNNLKIIRRYIAACLLRKNVLQLPPSIPESAPNKQGEFAFLMNLEQSITGAIVALWIEEELSEEERHAKANWLIENLYMELQGLLKTVGQVNVNQDDRYMLAISLSGLIASTLAFFPKNEDSYLVRKNYFNWLEARILKTKFEADPNLISVVTNNLKNTFFNIQDKESKMELTRFSG